MDDENNGYDIAELERWLSIFFASAWGRKLAAFRRFAARYQTATLFFGPWLSASETTCGR